MKEFGSDFHYNTNFKGSSETNYMQDRDLRYYANGRQAILHLIDLNKWNRIWIPEYYCYQIVETIKNSGIEIKFYPDAPRLDDTSIIESLRFRKKDVILRMNYFGLRSIRDNRKIPIEVIEDHSHDLFGVWSNNSNADWCVASIRKTLPIPEGGILWSPQNHALPKQVCQTEENISIVERRWKAMKLKLNYLAGYDVEKDEFRNLFLETENSFDIVPLSDLTEDCKMYLSDFDFSNWEKQKLINWEILSKIKSNHIEILLPEANGCNMFSFIFLTKTVPARDIIRDNLIQNHVYPAILWDIPDNKSEYSVNFSKRMFSIPCDGRYIALDILEIKKLLENAFQTIH